MKEIDHAMNVIKGNTYGDAEGLKLIREQLELVAKAARREARMDAFACAGGLRQAVDAWIRALAEGTT